MHTALSPSCTSLHSVPFSHQNISPASPSTSQELTPLTAVAQLQALRINRVGTVKKTSPHVFDSLPSLKFLMEY